MSRVCRSVAGPARQPTLSLVGVSKRRAGSVLAVYNGGFTKWSRAAALLVLASIAIFAVAVMPTVAVAKANPYANHVAFVRGDRVWRANSHGGHAKRLSSVGAASDPTWSGDHRRIYFIRVVGGGKPAVCWVSASGGRVHVLAYSGATPGVAEHLAASSDGRWLYISGSRPDDPARPSEVVRVNLKTKRGTRVLTILPTDKTLDSGISDLDVDRGGGRLVFIYFEGDSVKVHVRSLRTGHDDAAYRDAWEVRFSRSGKSLAYSSDPRYGNSHRLGYMSLKLRTMTTLLKRGSVEDAWGDELSAFSPDGKKILFQRQTSGPSDVVLRDNLMVLGSSGGKPRLLVRNASDADW